MFICRAVKSHKIKNRTRRTHGCRIGWNYIVSDCYAPFWSYGEICVGCGCCGKPSAERDKARLNYWQEMEKIEYTSKNENSEWVIWKKPSKMIKIYEKKLEAPNLPLEAPNSCPEA